MTPTIVQELARPLLRGTTLFLVLATACAAPPPRPPPDYQARVEAAEKGLEDDPAIAAGKAGVEAARAREGSDSLVDEVELRVGDDYRNKHEVRVTARVPITLPSELRAQREVRRADTEVAISRLEEISLERRAERCFPGVDATAYAARRVLFDDYAERQQELLRWNDEWRASGTIDELSAARFELEGHVRLAAWETSPSPVDSATARVAALPPIRTAADPLDLDVTRLRETVRRHHPSVSLRRATAQRYAALAQRERERQRPGIRFIDFSYEERTRGATDGVGGRLAFRIPFGKTEQSRARRYDALVRQEHGEEAAATELQLSRALFALQELREFEARSESWQALERLAEEGTEIADRWWARRAARPNQVASLLDEAFSARNTVLDARERAANARCTLLATTGVPIEHWPRNVATFGTSGAAER